MCVAHLLWIVPMVFAIGFWFGVDVAVAQRDSTYELAISSWVGSIGTILAACFTFYAANTAYRIWLNDKYLRAISIIQEDFEENLAPKFNRLKQQDYGYEREGIYDVFHYAQFSTKQQQEILTALRTFCAIKIKWEINHALQLLKTLTELEREAGRKLYFFFDFYESIQADPDYIDAYPDEAQADIEKFNEQAEQYCKQKDKILSLLYQHII